MKVNFKNSFWHQFVEHFIVMCINQIFSKKSLETSSILILFKKKNTKVSLTAVFCLSFMA